jgi:hypothetical protein
MTAADFRIRLTDFYLKVLVGHFLLKEFLTALALVWKRSSVQYVGLLARRCWGCYPVLHREKLRPSASAYTRSLSKFDKKFWEELIAYFP